jgi:cytochrome c oxidase subunit II
MWQGFPLRPDQASTIASGVDHLYYFLTFVDLFFTALIFLTIFYFAIRYRRRLKDERPPQISEFLPIEVIWTVIPLLLVTVMYLWGSSLYIRNSRPPTASAEVFVIGKQWMWHLQHPEGVREINELHVPVGRPIKLTMTSDDVIHDFFIPAFRVKKDIVPGRYSSIWFEATKTGRYHFFCAQYCGAYHSHMTGWVIVMDPVEYQHWLSGSIRGESMAAAGGQLYQQFGCVTCHGTGKGPPFAGLYGKPVLLATGETVTADNDYLRESILDPSAKIVNGYPAIMPTFRGQISEEQLLELIAYIKSLGSAEGSLGKP